MFFLLTFRFLSLCSFTKVDDNLTLHFICSTKWRISYKSFVVAWNLCRPRSNKKTNERKNGNEDHFRRCDCQCDVFSVFFVKLWKISYSRICWISWKEIRFFTDCKFLYFAIMVYISEVFHLNKEYYQNK